MIPMFEVDVVEMNEADEEGAPIQRSITDDVATIVKLKVYNSILGQYNSCSDWILH